MSILNRFGPFPNTGKAPLPPTDLVLEGERLRLRLGKPKDWQAWRDLRQDSRAFLTPWEPRWSGDALTFDTYTTNLRRQWREWKEGTGYAFLIFLKGPVEPTEQAFSAFGNRSGQDTLSPNKTPDRLVGGIALSPLERGPAQRGELGYWIGEPYARQGLMTEAGSLMIEFGFETLNLHRIEANCMPSNLPSKRLLTRLGFREEGRAKSLLRINGTWEDHLLWGLVRGESRP